MQRLVFEESGHLVRLSANICQLHRPNTIPIFCTAVCRDYRLRTFIAIAFKLLFVLLGALFFDALSDLEHVLVGGGDDFGALAQVFADFIGCGTDVLFVL